MKRRNTMAIRLFCIIFCFFNSFVLYSNEEKLIDYVLSSKSKGVAYELYYNGFLLSSKKETSSARVSCLSKEGKNRIVVNIIDKINTDNPEVINVRIKELSMIDRGSTISPVLSWNITVEQGKNVYEKEIELEGIEKELPWKKADRIETLTADDIERIESTTLLYKNTLKKGDEKEIEKTLATLRQFLFKAEAMLAGKSEADMIKGFMVVYNMLFAPSVRGNVYEYKEGELDVFKSPYDDRIVIVKTKTQKPIIKIETGPDDEGESICSGLTVSKLHFIKVAGKWYIY